MGADCGVEGLEQERKKKKTNHSRLGEQMSFVFDIVDHFETNSSKKALVLRPTGHSPSLKEVLLPLNDHLAEKCDEVMKLCVRDHPSEF